MTLFSYHDTKGVVLHKDAVKLEPLLGKLPAEDLLFIILAYDYQSPYRQLPEQQRIRTAFIRAFNTEPEEKTQKRLEKAIEKYRSLQYDIRRETIKNYQAKIASLNIQLMATDAPAEIKRLHESIEFLSRASDRLQKEVLTGEMAEYMEQDSSMSFLERWQDNKRRFKNDKQSIDLIIASKKPIEKDSHAGI